MDFYTQLFTLLALITFITCAPVPKTDERQPKSLSFYDYVQPEDEPADFDHYEPENDDYVSLGLDDNEISRAIPSRKRIRNRPSYNSPVYYIRLPPQPYMFVPGLGYVSQPPSNAISQFVNVPVSFVANGKPSAIYQWGGALDTFPGAAAPPPPPPPPPAYTTARPKPKPVKPADSTIHRLPGTYAFNGKPNDIFVLRDSYNSLYGDALQNFYP